jgi:Flp pilus assembly protein TadG
VSAIEFALFGGILSLAILNITDVSIYIYRRMQVENATQMGAQAAWAYCDPSQPGNANILPATTKCSALKPNPGLNAVIDTALHSTSLGTAVSRQSGSPTEGYYCANSGALVAAGTLSSPSPDCSSVGNGNAVPGDYIQVTAQFTYIPLFPGITVANVLPGTITQTAWMRLN